MVTFMIMIMIIIDAEASHNDYYIRNGLLSMSVYSISGVDKLYI